MSRFPLDSNSEANRQGSHRPRVQLQASRKEGVVEVQSKTLLHCFRQGRTVFKKCFGPFESLLSRLKHCHDPPFELVLPVSYDPEGPYQDCHVPVVPAGVV